MRKIIPLISILLAGCVSEEPKQQKKAPLVLTSSIESLSIAENSKKNFEFPVQGVSVDKPKLSAQYEGFAIVESSYSDGTVNVEFESFDVLNDTKGELNIKLNMGDETAVLKVLVTILNTSAQEDVEFLLTQTKYADKLFEYPEEVGIFNQYVKLGKESGDLSASEAQVLLDNFETIYGRMDASACEYCSKQGILNILANYESGQITEHDLSNFVDSYKDRLHTQGRVLRQIINEASIVTDLPDIGLSEYFVDDEGYPSQFIGHPKLGSYIDGQFIFDGTFSVVRKVVEDVMKSRVNASESTCLDCPEI